MQRPWKSTAYWCALRAFLYLHPYRTQDHQAKGVPTHKGWSLSYQSLIKKYPTARSYGVIL